MTDGQPEWPVIDHICRFCFGRVLQLGDDLRCSGCGATAKATKLRNGVPSRALCCCGLSESVGQKARQFYRCRPNSSKVNPGDPEIVCTFGGQVVPQAVPA